MGMNGKGWIFVEIIMCYIFLTISSQLLHGRPFIKFHLDL